MSEIYVITNKVNGKQYVGKTNRSAETRFKEHKHEMLQDRSYQRPLYRAMRKYGADNFDMEIVSIGLSPQEAEQQEIDLIHELGTFNKGYNATIGGDGKTYRLVSDEDIAYLVDLYTRENLLVREISILVGADVTTISNRLKEAGVEIDIHKRAFANKPIVAVKGGKEYHYNSVDELIAYLTENNITAAKRKSVSSSIKRCLDGERATYLGYTFRQQ